MLEIIVIHLQKIYVLIGGGEQFVHGIMLMNVANLGICAVLVAELIKNRGFIFCQFSTFSN